MGGSTSRFLCVFGRKRHSENDSSSSNTSQNTSNFSSVSGFSSIFSTSSSSNSDQAESNTESEVTPSREPNLPLNNYYMEKPKNRKKENTENPIILHIINERPSYEEYNRTLNIYYSRFQANYYISRMKENLLSPNWMQFALDREIRLKLRPVNHENKGAMETVEGSALINKIRYLLLKISPDPKDALRGEVSLQENHGNKCHTKRRRFRRMYVQSLFLDHASSAMIIEGEDFYLTVTKPFEHDVIENRSDPGGLIDVGLYCRELDSNPAINIKWYILAQTKDLPSEAFENPIHVLPNAGDALGVDLIQD